MFGVISSVITRDEAAIPLKQGLKPICAAWACRAFRDEAAIPLKQGLKHKGIVITRWSCG